MVSTIQINDNIMCVQMQHRDSISSDSSFQSEAITDMNSLDTMR